MLITAGPIRYAVVGFRQLPRYVSSVFGNSALVAVTR